MDFDAIINYAIFYSELSSMGEIQRATTQPSETVGDGLHYYLHTDTFISYMDRPCFTYHYKEKSDIMQCNIYGPTTSIHCFILDTVKGPCRQFATEYILVPSLSHTSTIYQGEVNTAATLSQTSQASLPFGFSIRPNQASKLKVMLFSIGIKLLWKQAENNKPTKDMG